MAAGLEIPDDIKDRLSAEQQVRLEKMMAPEAKPHVVAYRASVSVFGKRLYLALFAGKEARSLRRLRGEGVKRRFVAVLFEVALFCLAVSGMLCVLAGIAIVAAYLLKIALGIDLFEGPSFLHPIFELIQQP